MDEEMIEMLLGIISHVRFCVSAAQGLGVEWRG